MSIKAWSEERFSDEVVWDAINCWDETDVKPDPETEKTVQERFDSYLRELSKIKGSEEGVMPHASFYSASRRHSEDLYNKSECAALREGYVYRITDKALLKAMQEAFPLIKKGIPGLIGAYIERSTLNKSKLWIIDMNTGLAFDTLDRICLNERNELTNTDEVLDAIKKVINLVKERKPSLDHAVAIAEAHPERTVQAMDEAARRARENKGIMDLQADEEVKEAIQWFAREAGVHSIEDITLALALYPVHNPEETERFLQAWKDKRNDGPFEELTETCGYPIFRDQILAVMKKRLDFSFDRACALADGMAKKTTKARDELYRQIRVPEKVLDDLWKYTARVKDRRWLRHYATLIYEAVWLLQNGSREAFAEHPIVIGGNAIEERKDNNR